MLGRAESVAVVGLDGHLIDVEVSITPGIPMFTVVGLPDASVQESRERVRAAIQNSSESWPQQRITVNLSPAQLRKVGSGYDVAIALGVLSATGRIDQQCLNDTCLVGELSLDGRVRRVRGVLAAAMAARRAGRSTILVPRPNAAEAALVEGIAVVPAETLGEAAAHFRGRPIATYVPTGADEDVAPDEIDLCDVRGQQTPKRALEIAAAGGHNLMMRGTPGGGKTMLARRLPTILPPLSHEEALEVTRIYSVAGLLGDGGGLVRRRPFRAPHHTVSTTGLIGGGSGLPYPGEISLAHRGILFMDEAAEFRRDALEALRGPIEDGWVTIVRSRFAVTYPSRFQMVIAMNPCPCGFAGDPKRACTCLAGVRTRYEQRLSGPIVDRVDLQVDVPRLTRGELFAAPDGDQSEIIRKRVTSAREFAWSRQRRYGLATNAEIPVRLLDALCPRSRIAHHLLEREVENKSLTARSAHRILRVARTIADIDGVDRIEDLHVAEAVRYKVG